MTQEDLSNLISKKESKKDRIEKVAGFFSILSLLTLAVHFLFGSKEEESIKIFVILFFIFGGISLILIIIHTSVFGNEIEKLKIDYILNHFGYNDELKKKLKGLLYKQLDLYYIKTYNLEQKKRNTNFEEN